MIGSAFGLVWATAIGAAPITVIATAQVVSTTQVLAEPKSLAICWGRSRLRQPGPEGAGAGSGASRATLDCERRELRFDAALPHAQPTGGRFL